MSELVSFSNHDGVGVITRDHRRERFTFEVEEDAPPLKLGLLDAYPKITGPYGQNWVCDFWQLTRVEDGDHFDVEIAPFALHEPYTVH